ncbi:hypothetical protein FIBSPDRAFT_475577 [Athelia psychrophila]|uniref:Uncharacterized protein n=1 Tax=Athelia psychrophila TaxID=1759441 RepID=A0A166L6S7_9AGAM|nr:hypothetical protein FIBSPDRAFT_475577 [Fibularhizoctonia sp. CBS 109695]
MGPLRLWWLACSGEPCHARWPWGTHHGSQSADMLMLILLAASVPCAVPEFAPAEDVMLNIPQFYKERAAFRMEQGSSRNVFYPFVSAISTSSESRSIAHRHIDTSHREFS